jgi:outer membrane protein TolC
LLRGYDAQIAIYTQSIDLYRRSLDIVKAQFAGAIASALDVARVESLLFTTETQLARVQGQRQVTEQAIAILVNMAPASFIIKPKTAEDLRVASFALPTGHRQDGASDGAGEPGHRHREGGFFPRCKVQGRRRL